MIARYTLVSVGAATALALVVTALIGMIGGDLFRSATLFAIVIVPVVTWTVGGALALVAATCLAVAAVYPWRGGFAAEPYRAPASPDQEELTA